MDTGPGYRDKIITQSVSRFMISLSFQDIGISD